MNLPVTSKVPYGGDYNPEQWPEEVWKQDYRLFDAARIDTVTVGVFTWALTQPALEVYDFTMLDRVVERASAEGRTSAWRRAPVPTRRGWRARSPR